MILDRSAESTAQGLGEDRKRYLRLMEPLIADWPNLESTIQHPFGFPLTPAGGDAFRIGRPATRFEHRQAFIPPRAGARAFCRTGGAFHVAARTRPERGFGPGSGNHGAHRRAGPSRAGGSQSIANALAAYLKSLGGEIVTGTPVASIEELPRARAILCDVTPRQLLRLAGSRLTPDFRHKLERYRYGPGVCKLDWALNGPIPWKSAECGRAGTVHLGGTFEEIAESERAPFEGNHSEKPFVLLAQPTLFDRTRAPAGKHIAWGYCHVPNGSERGHDRCD